MRKITVGLVFLIGLIFMPLLSGKSLVFAKPMMEPTIEEGIKESKWIVVAEYVDYDKNSLIGYFHGPAAEYKISQALKGDLADRSIRLRYDFQDGSACIALRGWEFNSSLMPKAGSSWILLLKDKDKTDGLYITYRGDFGRLPATRENLDKVGLLLMKK